jgi:hypothetical protein
MRPAPCTARGNHANRRLLKEAGCCVILDMLLGELIDAERLSSTVNELTLTSNLPQQKSSNARTGQTQRLVNCNENQYAKIGSRSN